MPRLVHFEIHADDLDRMSAFYTELFGWTFTKWAGPGDYRLITTGPDGEPGINGGMVKRMGPKPADGQPVNAFTCTVSVPDLDARMTKALALGATVALPKMAIPGVGWLAYIKDLDGNILGMMQRDPEAK